MCTPSIVAAALATPNRRDALHYLAGLVTAVGLADTFQSTSRLTHEPSEQPPSRPAARRQLSADHILDLTHTLRPEFPIWPGNAPLKLTNKSRLPRDQFYANRWDISEHHGTHLDAPAHASAQGATAEQIPAATLIAPLAVLDLRAAVKKDADYAVSLEDIHQWEKRHGRLPNGCAVALCSGWDAKADDPLGFLGSDASGTLHFPGFSREAAQFLAQQRQVVGLIVDTLSIDIGPSTDFVVHKLWLGAGKWAIECAAHLADVPPVGATVCVGLPKVAAASGGPIRLLALW
jgi:kynurenine formamidase